MPAYSRSSTGAPEGGTWVTILAGGVGSRFWPLSTPSRPKQLLQIDGDRPLVARALDRARQLVDTDHIRIVTGKHLVRPLLAALPGLGPANVLVEPHSRGTAPALAWAAWSIVREDPEAVMISLHADQLIEPEESFTDCVLRASRLARKRDLLLTVGVRPDRAELAYGYIQPGERLPGLDHLVGYRVRSFHEKPDRETAEQYLAAGFLWNTGIFVWKARSFLDELVLCAPEVGAPLALLDAGDLEGFFAQTASVAVDVAVLERSSNVGVVEAKFAWKDMGGWEALASIKKSDPEGNVVVGDAATVDARHNVVYAEEGPVVLYGVEDMLVVRTGGVVLVTTRARSQRLKELLADLPESMRDPVP